MQKTIIWQKCLGGSSDDWAESIQQTADGGYVVAGWADSNDGDVSGKHDEWDCWVVKLDPSGNLVWQKCLGGSSWDSAGSVQQTADGGYIVAGYAESNNGDVSGNHGSGDFWVVKLDPSGNIVWQKCLGGSSDDEAFGVRQTADGGYIVAGYAESNNGDVSGNHGWKDCWVVKLDTSGNLVWQKCLGGISDEWANSVQQTADGRYMVAGYAEYNGGDVSGNHGSADFWIIKLSDIDCTITAPDVVNSGSTGNAASTAESGASYAWSITNGAITSASNAQSISFTAGTSGTTRLAVNVTKKGSWNRCYKDITIKPKPDSSQTSDLGVGNSPAQQPSGMESRERDSGDGQASTPEDSVRIYPG